MLCLVALFSLTNQSARAQCQSEGMSRQVVQTTADTVKIYGWEHALTQRDPSLSRWDWEPITHTQYDHSKPAWGVAQPKSGLHYVKPEHVAFQNVEQPSISNRGYNHSSSNSSGYKHTTGNSLGYKHSETNVAGTIRSHTQAAAQSANYAQPMHEAVPQVTASYTNYTRGPSSNNRAQIARAEVAGQLVSR